MKKLLSIILSFAVMATLAGCGDNAAKNNPGKTDKVTETSKQENIKSDEDVLDNDIQESADDEKSHPTEDKQSNTVNDKETSNVNSNNPQANKPSDTPQIQPKPEQKPTQTPVPAPTTLGKTLLADFKTKASSGMTTQEIADALLTNSAIKFSGGAMPVEEGLLSGFDNAEITGFKSGVMFAPMIGSIPFVGYVFELNNASDASAFIAKLEKNANLRWNICVEADEMVTGSSGNKVFFVMCPKTLEE